MELSRTRLLPQASALRCLRLTPRELASSSDQRLYLLTSSRERFAPASRGGGMANAALLDPPPLAAWYVYVQLFFLLRMGLRRCADESGSSKSGWEKRVKKDGDAEPKTRNSGHYVSLFSTPFGAVWYRFSSGSRSRFSAPAAKHLFHSHIAPVNSSPWFVPITDHAQDWTSSQNSKDMIPNKMRSVTCCKEQKLGRN